VGAEVDIGRVRSITTVFKRVKVNVILILNVCWWKVRKPFCFLPNINKARVKKMKGIRGGHGHGGGKD